ncbi:hypothetical protein LTR40_014954, partial [Exophiala xenobiotica]
MSAKDSIAAYLELLLAVLASLFHMEGNAQATVRDATKMGGRETPYISADMKTHRHEGLRTVNSDK